ncbi:MAG: glycosyltransferase [Bacilli bacterium]|nr:glycosyltransferase [Bacilli bacterium]
MHTFVVLAYKESKYLEDCIKSVLNQSYNSKVVIATTTDNKFIRNLAKKYELDVIVGKHTNIGGDFDFAVQCGETPLVTVAHQDDIYDYDYAKRVADNYLKYSDASIIFTDYYEIRDGKQVVSNLNLKIKRILLFPLRVKCLSRFKFFKRFVLRFGNSICCPAVTFVKPNCPKDIFLSDYKCNVDWFAWEKLSKLKGRFIYINDRLMGHRISKESTTTDIINNGIRTKEDYDIYCKFWPSMIAKLLTKVYKNSEKSNSF